MSTKLETVTGFSRRLRAARELRALSQGDLARKSGLQSAAISHFETGRRRPSHANLLRLADALDVSTDYLTGRVDTTINEWKAASGYDDLLAAHSAALTERDALRAEVERLKQSVAERAAALAAENEGQRAKLAALAGTGLRLAKTVMYVEKLKRAAQSLHRAWRREREARLLLADAHRLAAFVSALRADGLDIDDPDTAPTWTGKIHDAGGRLVFDLATVGADPRSSAGGRGREAPEVPRHDGPRTRHP